MASEQGTKSCLGVCAGRGGPQGGYRRDGDRAAQHRTQGGFEVGESRLISGGETGRRFNKAEKERNEVCAKAKKGPGRNLVHIFTSTLRKQILTMEGASSSAIYSS